MPPSSVIKLGLVGRGIGYSLSPDLHHDFLHKCGLKGDYTLIDTPHIANPKAFLADLKKQGYSGINITMPYKELFNDAIAREITDLEAVNAIRLSDMTAINADQKAMDIFLNRLGGNTQKALIIGSGGASKAIQYSLRNKGIKIYIANRKGEGKKLADYLKIEDIEKAKWDVDLIINATPMGMKGYPECPLPKLLNKGVFLDLVYQPCETKLIQYAKAEGHTIIDGLSFLKEQAKTSFTFWTGHHV